MRLLVRTLSRFAAVISFIGLLLVWAGVHAIWTPMWLPAELSVGRELWDLVTGGSLAQLDTTASTLGLGLLVTFAIAAVTAAVMASSEVAEKALLPFVNGFLATPHTALIPVFTFIWGHGEITRVLATVAFALSPVILTWESAIKSYPIDLVEMASSFGAGQASTARYVRLPSAAAPLVAGVRIGVVQGIKGVVTAEVIIGVVGVGQLITQASQTFDIARLYAIVVVIIFISLVSYAVLSAIENRMTSWNR